MPLSQDPQKRDVQVANLTPGGPGRPKGSRNWSTVVREALDDEELFQQLLISMDRKPAWLATASPKTLMQAITIAQSLKALGGSHFAAEWVRKTGYGDHIDITSNGETIKVQPIIVSTIKPRGEIQEGEIVDTKTESTDESTASPEATTSN